MSPPAINSRFISRSRGCNSFLAGALGRISKLRLCRLPLLLVLSSLGCQGLFGQAPRAANLQVGHDSWTFREGAPENVVALAQTADGFLWLGTPTGLFRFDGTRFEPFHSPFGDKLLSTNILSLFAPPSGGLWIGYLFGGFSSVNGGSVKNYGELTGSVFDFAQDRDGIVWAAASSGLWRFEHSRWQHIGVDWTFPAGSADHASFDRLGILWVIAWQELLYLQPGSKQFRVAEKIGPGMGFTLDAYGTVMTSPARDHRMPAPGGTSDDQLPARPVLRNESAQIIDRNNSVWIVSDSAPLIHLAPSEDLNTALKRATADNSETYNIVPYFKAMVVDREGNIWFGEKAGLHRFSYSPLIRQELPKTAAGDFALVADEHGAVWIGSDTNLYHVSNGKIDTPQEPRRKFAAFAYRAPDKTFWFGGPAGLLHLVDRNLVRIDLPREAAEWARVMQTITMDRLGGLWVSFGRRGLYRLANGVWTSYGGHEDLPKTGVVSEFTDSLGRVWFGYTKNQLAVLEGERVQAFGPGDGLRVGNITAIYGRGSEIWIGGEFGLQQFDHGRLRNITAVDDEWLRGISGIVETANGDLWLNGLSGIFHIQRSEISEALKDPAYQVKGEHFGRRAGLPGFAAQIRPLPSAIEGGDGRLWFAVTNGVVWIDPVRTQNKVTPPPITIQSISVDDKNNEPVFPMKFPARTSSVQINYAAVSLSDPEAIRFRYKLQETDKDWHQVAGANTVSYRNLAPGSYHFSVAATDTNGVWSDQLAAAEFTILPAFYQTRWFLWICMVAALAALYFLYVLRLRKVTQRVRGRMQERLDERERIARDLHDTLLQSFHGVLLCFQAATNLLPERPAEAKQSLESAIDQTAQAITEGRDAVQGLRSSRVVTNDLPLAIDTLGEELAAGETNPSSAVFHVGVEGTPRTLHPILRDEVYRIAGEALRNAFKHAQAKRIEVEILYDQRQFRLRVRDDGKGIDPKLLDGDGLAKHYGLLGMRERAKLMGGKLAVWSEIDSGTELELRIPASNAYEASPERRRSWFAERLSGKDMHRKS